MFQVRGILDLQLLVAISCKKIIVKKSAVAFSWVNGAIWFALNRKLLQQYKFTGLELVDFF
jgi:hypothetical protein